MDRRVTGLSLVVCTLFVCLVAIFGIHTYAAHMEAKPSLLKCITEYGGIVPPPSVAPRYRKTPSNTFGPMRAH